jgi:hypothetical protein
LRKPPIWNVQRGLVTQPWRASKTAFPFRKADGGSIYPTHGFTRRGLNNGSANEVKTAA